MNVRYLLPEANEELNDNIDEIMENYSVDVNPLDQFFGNRKYYGESKVVQVNRPGFALYGNGQDKPANDLSNVSILYDAMKQLNPQQASNPLMWNYYAFADRDCRQYILSRWSGDDEQGGGGLKQRCLAKDSPESMRTMHALARLYWMGYCTYDEQGTDRYAMTRILLTNTKVARDIMMTDNCMCRTRIRGELKALSEFQQLHSDLPKQIGSFVRECNRYLNREGAVRNLNFLSEDEIYEMSYKFLIEDYNREKEKKEEEAERQKRLQKMQKKAPN